ncbi:MAG: hypothetical protein ABII00_11830 [Elusimicrobiota bacterium]
MTKSTLLRRLPATMPLLSLLLLCPLPTHAEAGWPDLAQPARAMDGGKKDAAVVVGIEDYAFVTPIPGAKTNALAWYDYFTQTRKMRPENVALLRDSDGTLEEMRAAAEKAARGVMEGGTLWFVFVGHGAPAKNGQDGLLVGADAQQKAASLQARSLPQGELLTILGKSRARSVHVVIDACFSGKSGDGAALASGLMPLVMTVLRPPADPRITVLTAAKSDQFAGALPGSFRPAFSYLTLGGLRGWADENGDGEVTAGELFGYAKRVLQATLHGRDQTPTLMGSGDAFMARSPRERGPDLAAMAKLEQRPARPGGEMFSVSRLPSVPQVRAPQAFKRADPATQDWRGVDVDALEKYDAVVKFDRDTATALEKAAKWRELAKAVPKFAGEAARRAEEWEEYERERAAAAVARRQRDDARDKDWEKLGRLLALSVVPAQDKERWANMFVEAYGSSPKDNPYMEDLSKHRKRTIAKAALLEDIQARLKDKGKNQALYAQIYDGYYARGAKDPKQLNASLSYLQKAPHITTTYENAAGCTDAACALRLVFRLPDGSEIATHDIPADFGEEAAGAKEQADLAYKAIASAIVAGQAHKGKAAAK